MSKDADHPPAVSSATAGQPATFMDGLQVSFDVQWEALINLSPTLRWEQDPISSKFMSHSWDLLPGVLLCAALPTFSLKQCIQMLCQLKAKPDFAANFCLPSLAAINQPLRLPDGSWELGTSI